MVLSKKNFFLILLSMLFSFAVNAQGNDLVIQAATSDMGYKIYPTVTTHFANQTPLPNAESPISSCGVISLMHNIAIANYGDWAIYNEFTVRVYVHDYNIDREGPSADLNVFDSNATGYQAYIEKKLDPMTACAPGSCQFSGNYFMLNNGNYEFGFYQPSSHGFLTCASAAVWEITSGVSNAIYLTAPNSNTYIGNVLATPQMNSFHFAVIPFFALATKAQPYLQVRIEIYGKMEGEEGIGNLLLTQPHAYPVLYKNTSPVIYDIYDAASISLSGGSPPAFASMQSCTLSYRKATEYFQTLEVSLSPNPVRQQLNISIEDSQTVGAYGLTVYDVQGNAVLREEVSGQGGFVEKTLATEGLAKGYYILKVTSQSGSTIKNFIKL